MSNAVFKIEKPKNEPVLSYAPGTKERKELKARLVELRNQDVYKRQVQASKGILGARY